MSSIPQSLRFLQGDWHGEGTLGGEPCTLSVRTRAFFDRYVDLEVETRRGGEVVHRERVVLCGEEDGPLCAVTFSASGRVQRWNGTVQGPRTVFVRDPREHRGPEDFRWTVERLSDDSYRDVFEVGPAPGSRRVVLDATYRRARHPI